MQEISPFVKWEGVEERHAPYGGQIMVVNYPEPLLIALSNLSLACETNELSERVLQLTTYILDKSPYHYTAYTIRRRILRHFAEQTKNESIWPEELNFLCALQLKEPKNFQLWQHRTSIAEEFDALQVVKCGWGFVSQILSDDAKNYHCYDHFLLQVDRLIKQIPALQLKIYEQSHPATSVVSELSDADAEAVVNELFNHFLHCATQLDLRNNSYWAAVFHFIEKSPRQAKGFHERFLEVAIKATTRALMNESTWAILYGLFNLYKDEAELNELVVQIYQFACEHTDPEGVVSTFAIHLRVRMLQSGVLKETDVEKSYSDLRQLSKEAAEFDSVRKNYWLWFAKSF